MKKSTGFLLTLAALATGLVLGVLLAPVSAGIGNNSGNTNNYYDGRRAEDGPRKEGKP